MFYVEKFISLLLFSPTIYIFLFFFAGVIIVRKNWKSGLLLFCAGLTLYLSAITPVVNMLARGIEEKIFVFKDREPDIYVVLGGGSIQNDYSIEPGSASLKRIVKGVERYNENPKKIYVSGGKIFGSIKSEGEIYRETLLKLGVLDEDIITEDHSKNTYENAKFIKEKIAGKNIANIGLITSAIHMPRSMYVFEKELDGMNIIPIKCDYLVDERDSFIQNYLPKIS